MSKASTLEKTKIQPLWDKVLVQLADAEEKTAGGIIIADSSKERPARGKVIAVGKGYRNSDGTVTPLLTKVSDQVLFRRFNHENPNEEIQINGEDYLVIPEVNIVATLS